MVSRSAAPPVIIDVVSRVVTTALTHIAAASVVMGTPDPCDDSRIGRRLLRGRWDERVCEGVRPPRIGLALASPVAPRRSDGQITYHGPLDRTSLEPADAICKPVAPVTAVTAQAVSMTAAPCTVLTIGHSAHPVASFVALLQEHDVTAVADVRSAPYSRFNPQFNRETLARSLEAERIRYVYLGDGLGGRTDDPSCYEDGRIRYDRVAATDAFKRALARVVGGAARHRIALMCAEKEPLDCHRTLLVARALDEQGVDVAHIHSDGRLEPHAAAMDRLLDLVKLPRDDLYRTRDELIATAVARKEGRVAHVDDALNARPVERGA